MDTGAIVGDADLGRDLVLGNTNCDVTALGHRLCGIDHEVDQNTMEIAGIADTWSERDVDDQRRMDSL